MRDRSTVDWTVLSDYLSGECSPEERAAVEAWVGDDAERRAVVERLRASWTIAQTPVRPALDVETLKGTVKARIADSAAASIQPSVSPEHSRRSSTSRGIPGMRVLLASAVIAATAIGIVVVRGGQVTGLQSRGHRYATTTGQHATVTLPDGSRVLLAPQTTLTVAEGFGEQTRTVSLVGEAQFDVPAHVVAPFLVRAGTVTTRVLGTTFDVRRYADDATVRVVVIRGKVATGNGHTPVTLTAGTVGQFTDSSATTLVTADPTAYTDWTRGRLAFTATPVPVMLATLERWYGYRFQLADSMLAARHVTAQFDVDAPAETMQLLQRLLHVTMTFNGSTVILHPEPRVGDESSRVRPRNTAEQFPVTTERGR